MQIQEKFRPELISRRGEYLAWGAFLLAGATWVLLAFLSASIHPGLRFLTYFLLGSGLMISFGNWMDRNTLLRLSTDGIDYENGLRKVSIKWYDIHQIEVYPSSWGKKVRIYGSKQRFDFRTLGEVDLLGKEKGRMGFAEGERILKKIIEYTGLEGNPQSEGSYTYQR